MFSWSVVFAALASPLVNPDGTDVQVVDVDGDGILDIAQAGGEGVYYGDGSGGFGPLQSYAMGVDTSGVIYGDLDGDGLPEALRFDFPLGRVHQGVGRGLGPVVQTLDVNVLDGLGVDADGDGDLDVLVTTRDGMQILRNDGSGTLTTEPPLLAEYPQRYRAVDVDGDGQQDVVGHGANRDTQWLRRDATGALLTSQDLLSVPHSGYHLDLTDVDGDGLLDVLSQSYTFPVYVYPGLPGGGFGDGVNLFPHASPFALADLDGSGAPGLVLCDDDVHWDPTFSGTSSVLWTASPASDRTCIVRPADLDGSGSDDLVVWDGDLTVAHDPLGGAPPTTLQHTPYPIGDGVVGDVDGDGLLDVVYAGQGDPEIWWVPGAGNGSFDPVQLLATTDPVRRLGAMDLTRDGLLDVLMIDDTGTGHVLVGTGGGSFAAPSALGAGLRGRPMMFDVDADGLDEWLVPLQDGFAVFDDDGAGGVVSSVAGAGDRWQRLAGGDTDGDGVEDLAAITATEVVVFRVGAGGLVEDLRAPAPGPDIYDLVLVDGDGDGVDHLLVLGACETYLVYGIYEECSTYERLYEMVETAGAMVSNGMVAEGEPPLASVDLGSDGLEELLFPDIGGLRALDAGYAAERLHYQYGNLTLPTGDLDEDGDDDVVVVAPGGIWVVWNGDRVTSGITAPGGATGATGDTGHSGQGSTETGDTGTSTPEPTDTGTEPTSSTDTEPDLVGTSGGAEDGGGCGCGAAAPTLPLGWLRRR